MSFSLYFQSTDPRAIETRALRIESELIDGVRAEAARPLALLLGAEWLAAVAAALWFAPGPSAWFALLFGGAVAGLPRALAPGSAAGRSAMAAAHMFMAGLLAHAAGAPLAACFAHFALLACLSFQLDWRALAAAAAAACLDHLLRAALWPESLGRPHAHAAWLLAEAAALCWLVRGARLRTLESARRQAQLEASSEDVSAEVEARTDSLRDSESRYSIVFRNSPLPMWLFDPETLFFFDVNDQASRVFGYSRGEFLDMPYLDILHPDEAAAAARALESVRGGDAACLQLKHRKACGAWLDVETTAHRVDLSGRKAVLMLANDITERKRAERAKEEMEVQLGHAHKLESIGQLASGIAHEINTPTQYIGDNLYFLKDAFADLGRLLEAHGAALPSLELGQAASLRRLAESVDLDYLSSEIPKSLDQALEGVGRVSTLVKAMKEFSHPGGREKTPSDINQAILSTVTVTRNEWKYVAKLETDLQADLPLVPCLLSDFNQVVLNLIVNASHAIAAKSGASDGAFIRISTRCRGDFAEIAVSDTGGGIPAEIRGRIFDPFFTTKGVGSGTGQGLAIARSVIVDKHGGTLHFESEVGVGSTFIIRLPLSRAAEPAAQEEGSDAREVLR